MNFDERLAKVAVIGAAGKMGSGILLLVAHLMATMKLRNSGYTPQVTAIDISEDRLNDILKYVEKQSLKFAEKNPDKIEEWFQGSGTTGPGQFASTVLGCIKTSSDMEEANDVNVIFEAVNEDRKLKTELFTRIEEENTRQPFYLTNTSSVPIHLLDQDSGLNGRIIGFHFYNPPAIQKLVELISAEETNDELHEFAITLAHRLGKVVVPANDIAGFIGNGHFMRDVLYGFTVAHTLIPDLGFSGAMLAVDQITRDYLIRPMGIFQLADYVGLDVVQFIMNVMDPFMRNEKLHVEELDRYLDMGVKGGQHPDGSQKDGIFSYEKGKITGVFDPERKMYIPVSEVQSLVDEYLGVFPEGLKPWKEVIRDPEREAYLTSFFSTLKQSDSRGAKLAMAYGKKSSEIGQKLVQDGVANREEDVNTVLLTGFYHVYGPVNQYF